MMMKTVMTSALIFLMPILTGFRPEAQASPADQLAGWLSELEIADLDCRPDPLLAEKYETLYRAGNQAAGLLAELHRLNYDQGFESAKDSRLSLKWARLNRQNGLALRLAAEAGEQTSAQVILTLLHHFGLAGEPADDRTALTWAAKAAVSMEDPLALYNLGRLHQQSDPVSAEAEKYLLAALEKGYLRAAAWLGMLHLDRAQKGHGSPEEREAAEEMFRRAAQDGDSMGQLMYGMMFVYEDGPASEEAREWIRRAAEQSRYLADYLLQAPDHDYAAWLQRPEANRELLRGSAELGGIHSQLFLARLLIQGPQEIEEQIFAAPPGEPQKWEPRETVEPRYEEAARWFQAAAAEEDREALRATAFMLFTGWGLEKDENQAGELMTRAENHPRGPTRLDLGRDGLGFGLNPWISEKIQFGNSLEEIEAQAYGLLWDYEWPAGPGDSGWIAYRDGNVMPGLPASAQADSFTTYMTGAEGLETILTEAVITTPASAPEETERAAGFIHNSVRAELEILLGPSEPDEEGARLWLLPGRTLRLAPAHCDAQEIRIRLTLRPGVKPI